MAPYKFNVRIAVARDYVRRPIFSKQLPEAKPQLKNDALAVDSPMSRQIADTILTVHS